MTLPATPESRMLPDPSPFSTEFWQSGERGELVIHRCRSCRRYSHPPLPTCHHCRSSEIGPEPIDGRATVEACTINVHQWLPGFPPPYVVAIVSLDAQPDVRLTTNVVGCDVEDVHVGMKVEVFFEQWDDVWLPLFRPVSA